MFQSSKRIVFKSSTDMTCGPELKRALDVATSSGMVGFVQPTLDRAALGLILWLGSELVF